VVIPRSSILLKNKKNINKLKANEKEKERAMKNYSVSPSRIMFNSKFLCSKGIKDNDKEESKDKIKYTSLKNYNKAKINFRSSKILNKEDSMNNLNESQKKGPFKFIKNKKNAIAQQFETYGAKSKISKFIINFYS